MQAARKQVTLHRIESVNQNQNQNILFAAPTQIAFCEYYTKQTTMKNCKSLHRLLKKNFKEEVNTHMNNI